MSDLEVAKLVLKRQPLPPAELREVRWWVERYALNDPLRAPAVAFEDASDLSSTGWGVLFSSEVTREIRQALSPLLSLRREQAGERYREFQYTLGQSKEGFLATHRAFQGPADPDSVPYYLLFVGSPEAIPFEFQHTMDIQYAVGRIWFDRPEDFESYAQSVVRADEGASALRSRSVVLFGVEHPGDRITQSLSGEFVSPLAQILSRRADWEVRLHLGAEATKGRLEDILKKGSQSLLLVASHGVSFPAGDERQLLHQGAILLGDWPGEGLISPDFCLSAEDLGEESSLEGSIIFLLTDFGGGTPMYDDFDFLEWPRMLAQRPFLSRLPQHFLSRGGALAVVSRVGRTWTSSLGRNREDGLRVFEEAIRSLLNGNPLGAAMEFFNQRFAEQAIALSSLWEDRAFFREGDLELYAQWWMTAQDLKNLVLFGDPAVRLSCDVG